MTLRLNKDLEAWDDVTGIVYNDDGTVRRPGLPRTTPFDPAAVAAAGLTRKEA